MCVNVSELEEAGNGYARRTIHSHCVRFLTL